MKRTLSIIICALLFLGILTGCVSIPSTGSNTDTSSVNGGAKTIKIGFSMPFNDEVHVNRQGRYEKYVATRNDIELLITNAKGSAQQQAADVESLIAQNCDVIIIKPADGATAGPLCDAVTAANIPLVIDEFIIASTNYTVRTPIYQADHGRAQGSYLQGLLDAGSLNEVKVGYIAGDGDDLMMSRRYGISDTCASAIFVADGMAKNWSNSEAASIVNNWIQDGTINEMNAIACMEDSLANAVVTALGSNYPDMIVLGAGGTNVTAQQNIIDGKLKATTYQNNSIHAENMLRMCIKLANGEQISYDDAQNKLVNLHSISLLTADTLQDKK